MRILCVIPARGGSKGLPKKNIMLMNGKPLIYYSIAEAKKSKYIDRIIISTDDKDIAEVALEYGAEVPFLRPGELAKDDTPGNLPVVHAVEWLKDNQEYAADYVVLLQPTSPLRTSQDIDRAMETVLQSKANYLASVAKVNEQPFWMRTIEGGKLKPLISPDESKKALRRQDLPEVYVLNGAIYIYKADVLINNPYMKGEEPSPYIMPRERSIDIDKILDFKIAEMLIMERSLS